MQSPCYVEDQPYDVMEEVLLIFVVLNLKFQLDKKRKFHCGHGVLKRHGSKKVSNWCLN